MSEFGTRLRDLRESCRDPIFPARKLSQQKFGELLGRELGTEGYSGAAISDWERGKSSIHAGDRRVLNALLKVLHDHGGLEMIEAADQLLESGNYRTLNSNEALEIFNEIPTEEPSEDRARKRRPSMSNTASLLRSLFGVPEKEASALIARAKRGPNPSWPRILAVFMRKASEQFSLSVTTILWVGVWLLAIGSISPSLRFPFANRDAAFLAMCLYAGGSLIIPLLIGILVNTKDNAYWSKQNGVSSFLLRVYTYQGAGVGFNVGYFLIFPLSLARYYLGFESTVWIEIVAATVSVVLGNMAARVVPHNLWLAYDQLTFKDGGIFFVVALMGPLWGYFFLEYYPVLLSPVLGILVILLALTFVVMLAKRKSKKQTA